MSTASAGWRVSEKKKKKKINPAHQNPNLPVDLSIKLRLLEDLYNVMEKAGKVVERKYY